MTTKFLSHLKKNHPITSNPKIKVVLLKDKIVIPEERGGGLALGVVNYNDDHVEIKMCTDRHPWLVLKALAHEYRHLLQQYNMNWEAKFVVADDDERELDAIIWSQKEVNVYLGR